MDDMTDSPRPPVQSPPAPWKHNSTYAVGGLFQVGYAEGSDLLLGLSNQGRGIFDCTTGARIARDYEDAEELFDPIRLVTPGFGPLAGQNIRMAGSYGGGLPHTTADGWYLDEKAPAWPTRSIYLTPPTARAESVVIGDDGACELRAFGFSQTGRSLVIAISCSLIIFTR